jgi:uncharacterized protein (TIRG00374 family)
MTTASGARRDDGDGGERASSAPSTRSLERRLLLAIGLGLLVYAGLVLYADAPAVARALSGFDVSLLLLAMALSFANYLVRFLRWELYRRKLGIRLSISDSFLIHLAGLALTVSPGKMGEAFKSWLVREIDGTPVSRSAPIVVAERTTDLCAFLVLVALGGLATAPEHAWIFWSTLGLCAVLLALVASRKFSALACAAAARAPLVHALAPRLEVFLASARTLLSPASIPLPTLLATAGWSLECTGFWLVANAFVPESPIPFAFAAYTFALSAVAGAVLILFPGGLGVTEGVMTTLLSTRYRALGLAPEIARASAGAATILIRLATLWFAVLVGFVALFLFRRRHRRSPGLDRE